MHINYLINNLPTYIFILISITYLHIFVFPLSVDLARKLNCIELAVSNPWHRLQKIIKLFFINERQTV
jgi:hypothetical protein